MYKLQSIKQMFIELSNLNFFFNPIKTTHPKHYKSLYLQILDVSIKACMHFESQNNF